jgi:hypothetical protein
MNVVNISRIRSGEAWTSCWCRNSAGSILAEAVIAVVLFELALVGLSKDHAVTALMSRTKSPSYRYTTLLDSTQFRVVAREFRDSGIPGPRNPVYEESHRRLQQHFPTPRRYSGVVRPGMSPLAPNEVAGVPGPLARKIPK